MLQRIESPGNVLAIRAVGKIEKADYETVLEPAVEAMIASQDEVRFVYVLGDDYDGYTASATWEDAKLGIGHASKWKRIAVVTNHDSLRHAVGMFGWMVPGDVKTFGIDEESKAMDWAAEQRMNVAPDSSAVRTALWRAMHVQIDAPPHLIEDEIGLIART